MPKNKMPGKELKREFTQFLLRGNVLDMAVGVIIGGAFGKITSSLVNDVLTPLLSLVTGRISFAEKTWVLVAPTEDSAGIVVRYGSLLQSLLDFFLMAFCVFVMLKVVASIRAAADETRKKLSKPPEPAPAEPAPDIKPEPAEAEPKPAEMPAGQPKPELPEQERLLAEIRDLLKEMSVRGEPDK